MDVDIWDKEKQTYIRVHNVEFIANLDNTLKVETKDNIIYKYLTKRYTLDFVHGGI